MDQSFFSLAASIGEDRHSNKTGPGSAFGLCTLSPLHSSTSHHLTEWVNESECYSEGATKEQAAESKGKQERERGREGGREGGREEEGREEGRRKVKS